MQGLGLFWALINIYIEPIKDTNMSEYIIIAYSAQTNTRQRELNLMGPAPTTAKNAQQWADSFATRCNQKRVNNATDWVGQIELVNKDFYVRTN